MTSALDKIMALTQFLDWEARQELRYEFDGHRPVAMTGGTVAHELIGGTLRGILRERLAGTHCRVFGPTIKIEVKGRIRYPDAFVSCGAIDRSALIVPEPIVVFEVLSAGMSRTARIEKLREYQATPSIRSYVILEQDDIAATVFERRGADWIVRVLTAEDRLDLPAIGISVALAEVYADLGDPVAATAV